MELIDKLRQIMSEQYGIETDEQLMRAAEDAGLDIGIFIMPPKQETKTA